ncbi:MAG: WYL domain-containing transcriptional regulator [Armatimonadota bacterium]
MTKSKLIIDLMNILKNEPGLTVNELSTRLKRSERTVYRWLKELTTSINAPIYCLSGGYYIADAPENTFTQLSLEELIVTKIALSTPPVSCCPYAEPAWIKIRDTSSWENLESMEREISKFVVDVEGAKVDIPSEIFKIINDSLIYGRVLKAHYRSRKDKLIKEYTLFPYAVTFRMHSYYLIAYCKEHEEVRTFRISRFISLAETNEKFEKPDNFSVEQYFKFSWGVYTGAKPVTARIKFDAEVADLICESKRSSTQVLFPQTDGSVIYQVSVCDIEELGRWVMSYGKYAEVLEPASLREYIYNNAISMAEKHSEPISNERTEMLTDSLFSSLGFEDTVE